MNIIIYCAHDALTVGAIFLSNHRHLSGCIHLHLEQIRPKLRLDVESSANCNVIMILSDALLPMLDDD